MDASESAKDPERAGRGGRGGRGGGPNGTGDMGGNALWRVGNLDRVGVAFGLIEKDEISLMSSPLNGFDAVGSNPRASPICDPKPGGGPEGSWLP